MNRFEEIRAFVAVAGTGSLVGASHEMKVTPSMIGRRVTNLERRLEAKLLHRSTRQMTLTEQGKLYFDHCRQLLSDLEEFEAAAFPETGSPSGELAVVAPRYLGRTHVAPHVTAFSRACPEVQVSLDLTNENITPMSGTYDLRIRIGNVIDPNFISVWLAENRRVICATPEYFRTHGRPEALQDLTRHDCVAIRLMAQPTREWRLQDQGHPVAVTVGGRFQCNDGEMLVRRTCEGRGLAWRSTWEVASLIDEGALETVLDEYALPSYDLYAVYPRHKPLSRAAAIFIQTLQAAYAQPGYWSCSPAQEPAEV